MCSHSCSSDFFRLQPEIKCQQGGGALANREPTGLHHDVRDPVGNLFLDFGHPGLDIRRLLEDDLPVAVVHLGHHLAVLLDAEGQPGVDPATREEGGGGPGPEQQGDAEGEEEGWHEHERRDAHPEQREHEGGDQRDGEGRGDETGEEERRREG